MRVLLSLFLAYLLGSIPTSYLVGRFVAGIDLRQHGSKNLGATNVFRVLGWKYAVPVLLLDAAKGTVAAVVISQLAGRQPWMPLLVGSAAVLGHVFTIFLGFKGGKGVATAAGVVAGVAPVPIAICVILWLVIVLVSGFVSLGSIIASIAFPIATRILHPADPYTLIAGSALALLIVYTHRANIRRLLDGTESRFGHRRKKEA
jgi:glycerol-3-phosphate acyltransferase PlsY